MFERRGYNTVVEPHYNTSAGLRKPDLLIYKYGQVAAVIDVTVTTDMYDNPDEPHLKKMAYYSAHDEITTGVTTLAGTPPFFTAFAVSFRGCVSPMSAESLRSLGLSTIDLGLLSAITVEQSAVVHRIFGMSTMRTRA